MVFISAGHNAKAKIKPDSGAIGVKDKDGKPQKEGILTIEFRDLVTTNLDIMGVKFIADTTEESLSQYLQRIKTGTGSVVVEFHFDASPNATATGTTALVGRDADRLDKAFAEELVNATAKILGIKNRGVWNETDSHRGRLGLMREQGTVALLELGFISNEADMAAYHKNKCFLAPEIARIVKKYEDII